MLKICFGVLLGVNAALFAYGQGYLGHFDSEEHEPARLKNQLNAKALTVIPASRALALAEAAPEPAPAPAPAPAQAASVACIEVGNFGLVDARRFEAQLASLELGDRQARRNVQGQEVSSYMVMIPPAANRETAEKRAAELKAKDIANFYIIPDGPQKNGISMGSSRRKRPRRRCWQPSPNKASRLPASRPATRPASRCCSSSAKSMPMRVRESSGLRRSFRSSRCGVAGSFRVNTGDSHLYPVFF
ncbi:hypothetical protein [Pseudoduganella plicata]|uniref:hypothetical protein n=1 Tax=Pseudoduganella plicata TaxID=321984 RepID=UPI001E416588|nr:hypothetical protein [Pseudoduganella plicata]